MPRIIERVKQENMIRGGSSLSIAIDFRTSQTEKLKYSNSRSTSQTYTWQTLQVSYNLKNSILSRARGGLGAVVEKRSSAH